jgi:hypothetical protein
MFKWVVTQEENNYRADSKTTKVTSFTVEASYASINETGGLVFFDEDDGLVSAFNQWDTVNRLSEE